MTTQSRQAVLLCIQLVIYLLKKVRIRFRVVVDVRVKKRIRLVLLLRYGFPMLCIVEAPFTE